PRSREQGCHFLSASGLGRRRGPACCCEATSWTLRMGGYGRPGTLAGMWPAAGVLLAVFRPVEPCEPEPPPAAAGNEVGTCPAAGVLLAVSRPVEPCEPEPPPAAAGNDVGT